MPSVPTPHDQQLPAMIADLIGRVRAIETQQQATYSGSQGQPVINTGISPGSNPPQYGFQLVDPSTRQEVAFYGEDGSGNVGLTFRDSSGNIVCRLDATGLHVYNSSGAEEVAAGLLNASPAIYGLATLPYGGSELQMVGGFLSVVAPSALNVTNTSWTDFGSPSSIPVEIGPSGSAVVSVQSYLATGTGGQVAYVGVSVDGGTPTGFLQIASGAGGISGTIGSGQVHWTGLTTGTHTFQLAYKTAANGSSTCSFEATALTISPL